MNKHTLLIAFGGNALIRKGQVGTIDEQFANLKSPMRQVAELSQHYKLVITHGNGPQVGDLLNRQECCKKSPPLPLEILVAQTQGQIGYMLESTLDSELMTIGNATQKSLVSLISYVVVDKNDPAFKTPTKPIGPILTEEQALAAPYATLKTAKGLRRAVASPKPITIVEKNEIQQLIDLDFIVICCGGGGIPVVREDRTFSGVDAVIDKDLASACLARDMHVDRFVIVTDVKGVYIDYGKPQQHLLKTMTVSEAENFLRQKMFPAGSMGPKVQACVNFIHAGGKYAVIGPIDDITGTVSGKCGTVIVP